MKIPGMTMSPKPSIAKLLADNPCSSRSWGNTTEKGQTVYIGKGNIRVSRVEFEYL